MQILIWRCDAPSRQPIRLRLGMPPFLIICSLSAWHNSLGLSSWPYSLVYALMEARSAGPAHITAIRFFFLASAWLSVQAVASMFDDEFTCLCHAQDTLQHCAHCAQVPDKGRMNLSCMHCAIFELYSLVMSASSGEPG